MASVQKLEPLTTILVSIRITQTKLPVGFWVFDDLIIFVFVIMFVCFIVLFLSPRIE